MSVHPLFAGILSAHSFRDRFRDADPVEDDFTGLACEIEIEEAPILIRGRVINTITGKAHITGRRCEGYDIDDLWLLDPMTSAWVSIDERAEDPAERAYASALVGEVERVAVERLREML